MKCPQCSSDMVANPMPDEREIVRAMVGRGSHPAYATTKAAAMREKEARSGVVHTCSNCRYVTRVTPKTAAEPAPAVLVLVDADKTAPPTPLVDEKAAP